MAWWSSSLCSFRQQSDGGIVERLNLRWVEGNYTARANQLPVWRDAVNALRSATSGMPDHWQLLLEYPLLRLGRRLDAVLLTDGVIFVMEFKTNEFSRSGRTQAEDYALDLRDFHAGSRHHPIVPILVAGRGMPASPIWPLLWVNYANPVFEASAASLGGLLMEIVARVDHSGIDIDAWEKAAYHPVPTIIEAARMLYRKHGVADIKSSRAGETNLTLTTDVILQTILEAKENGRHIIIFVTGIPGAGKTLCGLDAVFSTGSDATFLTGTLPMVYVLKAALAKDAGESDRKVKANIQSITAFLKDNRDRLNAPAEHVIVFDEAQRAWNAAYGAQKFQLADSEAGIVLDIMLRHGDYAVIVALVGTGQEINTGEAGLNEWGKALSQRLKWQIRAPANVINADEQRQCLFTQAPTGFTAQPFLHLDIPIRQIRSVAAAAWVNALIRGQAEEAKNISVQNGGIPFLITRSLSAMRNGLRSRVGGSHRAGLVCSSGAKRLVADGLWPKFDHLDDKAVANWFLRSWPDDVRASDALEIPATEFACQGLELDYVGLCWGGDLYWNNGWRVRRFAGTKWQNPAGQDAKDFRLNTYRVLLTRARYETIIWVPPGNPEDRTREPELFDMTVEFLIKCGATVLEELQTEPIPADTHSRLI
jgi:hypothetical protein